MLGVFAVLDRRLADSHLRVGDRIELETARRIRDYFAGVGFRTQVN